MQIRAVWRSPGSGFVVPLALGWLAAMPAPAGGQGDPLGAGAARRRPCDGDTITVVEVVSRSPRSTGLLAETRETTSEALGMRYVPTRGHIIAAYLRLAAGRVCTERDRVESERLLRAQPFIASASVRAFPDGRGHVALQVDVVDEVPFVIAARFGHGTVRSMSLGTLNLRGRGLSLVVNAERGFAFRDGFGIRAVKYGVFGWPDFLAVAAQRDLLGEMVSAEFAEPFLTDLQRSASHTGASLVNDWYRVVRPEGDDAALHVRRTAYDVGWVRRLGGVSGGPVVLIGAAVHGEDVRTGTDVTLVAESGLVPAPGALSAVEYSPFTITRVAGIAGVRALQFTTVRGFDALSAEQDVGRGAQFGILAGPSVAATPHMADAIVAGDAYAGMGTDESFVAVRALAEARMRDEGERWSGLVASGRLAWYVKPSPERTRIVTADFGAVEHLAFPVQLTFRDVGGGLPGFGQATYAGGRRAVLRLEERRIFRVLPSRADFAIGAFAAAGKLWAGDVPFGETTGIHGSAGISLMAAYPRGGKRTYRVDFALPFQAERGARFEVRLSSTDRTRLFWMEPRDLTRARTGAVPVNLMRW